MKSVSPYVALQSNTNYDNGVCLAICAPHARFTMGIECMLQFSVTIKLTEYNRVSS